MVLLAAAIFSKDGKPLLSRQFVEMTRARVEGLLTAFPKLIGTDDKNMEKNKNPLNCKQHTFVETESVRYVYQPLEKLYVLLLTTKASNILEDLETLRLFAKVIPEYSRSLDEYDIKENIFELIFAFDEIVALGYRENVNLAQIRTFTEMDSHEEKIFLAVRETQEKEAKENMKRKAKELQAKRENVKGGGYKTGFGSSSNSSGTYPTSTVVTTVEIEKNVSVSKPLAKPKVSSGKAMRLGGKGHVVDNFVDQLKAEGVAVEQQDEHRSRGISGSSAGYQPNQVMVQENVHIKIEEKLKIEASHDSGLSNMELLGILMLRLSNKACNLIRLKLDLGDAVQLQTHPNVDKKTFQASNILQSKSIEKAFPVDQDISLLKWRFQTQEMDQIPLLINCWPNKTNNGCSVNIEYELQNTNLELHDVVISITLPAGAGTPIIKELSGEYSVDARKTHLLWTLPFIDASNANGAMEFETKTGQVEDFFPLLVSFHSEKTLTGLKIIDVLEISGKDAKFSSETSFVTEKYEIL